MSVDSEIVLVANVGRPPARRIEPWEGGGATVTTVTTVTTVMISDLKGGGRIRYYRYYLSPKEGW